MGKGKFNMIRFNHPFEEFRSRALDAINDLSKKYEMDLERFARETEKYHSGEAYKQLKEEYDKLRREMELGFPVSEEERESIEKWIDDGNRRSHKFEYRFIPAGIGTVGKIADLDTGDEFDFTDYSIW